MQWAKEACVWQTGCCWLVWVEGPQLSCQSDFFFNEWMRLEKEPNMKLIKLQKKMRDWCVLCRDATRHVTWSDPYILWIMVRSIEPWKPIFVCLRLTVSLETPPWGRNFRSEEPWRPQVPNSIWHPLYYHWAKTSHQQYFSTSTCTYVVFALFAFWQVNYHVTICRNGLTLLTTTIDINIYQFLHL